MHRNNGAVHVGTELDLVYPTCIRRPRLGGPHWNIVMTFGVEKPEWCGYVRMVKNCEDMIIRFDRVHERDGQTDIQTDTA